MNQLVRSRRADGHRAPGPRPRLRPPGPARTRSRCTNGSGPRSWSRCTARGATSPSMRGSRSITGCRMRWSRRTATSIRLAPGEPKKVDEVRVGRLVLDGDVILPADGATVNERRKIGYGGTDHGRASRRRRWPARRQAFDPTVRSSGRRGPRRLHRRCDRRGELAPSAPAWMKRSCANRCASRCAAAQPCGPARSRW